MYVDLLEKFQESALPRSIEIMRKALSLFDSVSYDAFENDIKTLEDSGNDYVMASNRDVLNMLLLHINKFGLRFGVEFASNTEPMYMIDRLQFLTGSDVDIANDDEDPTLEYALQMGMYFGTSDNYEYLHTIDMTEYHDKKVKTMQTFNVTNNDVTGQLTMFLGISKHPIPDDFKHIDQLKDLDLSYFKLKLSKDTLTKLTPDNIAELFLLSFILTDNYNSSVTSTDIVLEMGKNLKEAMIPIVEEKLRIILRTYKGL